MNTPHTARWLFAKGLEADPKNALIYQAWADMEGGDEKWHEAERLYLEAAAASTSGADRARIYFDLGFMFSLLRQESQAIKYLQLAIDANPSDYRAHAKLARTYAFLNRWDEAERHFGDALKINPDDDRTRRWYENMQRAREREKGKNAA